jgi:hypothetical protein
MLLIMLLRVFHILQLSCSWCRVKPVLLTHSRPAFGLSLLLQVKLASGEVIGAPSPADVMAAASRTVLSKLDRVEGGVIDFFMPAATRLMASPQPERVLAAALASMSGFRSVAGSVAFRLCLCVYCTPIGS